MAPSKAVAAPITREELDQVTSIAEFEALANALGVVTDDETESVVGLPVLGKDDKGKLLGVPFLLVSWTFNESDIVKDDGTPGEFVSATIMDNAGKRWILNDGSTGIYAQLKKLTAEREAKGHPTPQGLRKVSGGLRVSEYTNEYGKAKTFYLVG